MSSARHRRKGDRTQQAAAPIHLSVYSGRELLGAIVDRGGECEAAGAVGQPIGKFGSRKAAVDAIWQATLKGGAS
jgi:hypothetical protein